MPELNDFTKDERDMIVALPYRVGLWVGSSDDSGGNNSAEAEARALELIVTGFAEDFCKSQFVQTMMEETVSRKAEWKTWGDDLDDVPGECERAVDALTRHLDRKEVTSFKLTLMEIGTFVALAYRELEDSDDLASRMRIFMMVIVDKVRGMMSGKGASSIDELLNISDAEKAALDKLSKSLGMTRDEKNLNA